MEKRGDSLISLMESTLLPGAKISEPLADGHGKEARSSSYLGQSLLRYTRAQPLVAFGITSDTVCFILGSSLPLANPFKNPSFSPGFLSLSLT